MAENPMQQRGEPAYDDGRSTVASSEGCELEDIDDSKKEVIAKLSARVAALEAENKLLKERKGLFSLRQ
jgi:cell division protein FtsB